MQMDGHGTQANVGTARYCFLSPNILSGTRLLIVVVGTFSVRIWCFQAIRCFLVRLVFVLFCHLFCCCVYVYYDSINPMQYS